MFELGRVRGLPGHGILSGCLRLSESESLFIRASGSVA